MKARMWTIFFIVALTCVQVLISSSVSVPPTGAELVGHQSGSELMVKEEEEVELKCIIHNARPRPDIIWYLGDNEFVRGMSPCCQPFLSSDNCVSPVKSIHKILSCQLSYITRCYILSCFIVSINYNRDNIHAEGAELAQYFTMSQLIVSSLPHSLNSKPTIQFNIFEECNLNNFSLRFKSQLLTFLWLGNSGGCL